MGFSVLLEDRPGALAQLLGTIAEARGNIIHIDHSQGENDTLLDMARVVVELETTRRDI